MVLQKYLHCDIFLSVDEGHEVQIDFQIFVRGRMLYVRCTFKCTRTLGCTHLKIVKYVQAD